MDWQQAVERTVTGLGYEFVAVERAARGLLRVVIDRVPGDPAGEFITVDDCEQVTRQLLYVLEVEGCDYARLEVSSPGLDRPLRKLSDYQRFDGQSVELTLKSARDGRKNYRGRLQAAGAGWQLVFGDGAVGRTLDFSIDEVREARLVPVVDFKGRAKPVRDEAAAQVQAAGGRLR